MKDRYTCADMMGPASIGDILFNRFDSGIFPPWFRAPKSSRFSWTGLRFRVGCPRNEKKKFSVRTETNRNKICFAFVSVCFVKPKKHFFGLFRCFEPISKQPKQTKLFRNEPKQSGSFWKIPKYAFYPNSAEHSLAYCSWTNKFLLKRILKQE